VAEWNDTVTVQKVFHSEYFLDEWNGGYPFSRGALGDRSATQKSAKGSGSAACDTQKKAVAENATKSSLVSAQVPLVVDFAIAAGNSDTSEIYPIMQVKLPGLQSGNWPLGWL
jgi:hypothetical protein